jgi:hypothetical protein
MAGVAMTTPATLPPLTEKLFQRQVVELAKMLGWRVFHPFLSKWSERGFPDLTMVRARDRRLIFAELKAEAGRLTPAQGEWQELLGAISDAACGIPPSEVRDGRRIEVHVWKPSNFDEIQAVLR